MSNQFEFYDGGDATYPAAVAAPPMAAQQPHQAYFDPSAYTAQPPPMPTAYSYPGKMMNPSSTFDEEPPLLEELGVNFDHIWRRTMFVLHPVEQTTSSFLDETDLAGPLIFCLLFGACLLARGKMHFGYIYGVALIGCLGLWSILSLMSTGRVSVGRTASVLGYCLLPMVGLAAISLIIDLAGIFGVMLTIASIVWCARSSARMFAAGLHMGEQRLLIAYPCFLLYGVFALMTVF